jgi:hypothetical protein
MAKGNHQAIGQPVKLFKKEILDKFLQAIMKGASYKLASQHAGVSYQQCRDLIKRAKRYIDKGVDENGDEVDENNPYIETHSKIESAIAYRALRWLQKIDEASNIHWQAAAWKLERCHPEDYAKKEPEMEKKIDENADEITKLKEIVHKCMKPMD